jgi:DNA-binding MarR family transcriptional regulator
MRAATRRIGARYDEALSPFGINIAQYALLSAIRRQQIASLTDLAVELELDRSTVGRNVRVLERMELVRTARNGVDQREAVVSLSEDGTRKLALAKPRWEACQRAVETMLGEGGVERLEALVAAL